MVKFRGISYFALEGPETDAENYRKSLCDEGHSEATKKGDAFKRGIVIVSGGTLALKRCAWGDVRAEPLEIVSGWLMIYWPEITSYLNDENLKKKDNANALSLYWRPINGYIFYATA